MKSDTVIIDEGMMRTKGMPIARPALMLSAWVRSSDYMYPLEFLMESSFKEWEYSACPISGILDRKAMTRGGNLTDGMIPDSII